MNALPRWLTSMTDMPEPCQSVQLFTSLLQDFEGQRCRPRGEIEYAHEHPLLSGDQSGDARS